MPPTFRRRHYILKRLAGYLKTLFYRKPKEQLRLLRLWGPRSYFLIENWKHKMASAAYCLPSLPSLSNNIAEPLEVWYLTGSRFWYQTAFCAWTLCFHSAKPIRINIVDDGTLTAHLEAELRRIFPNGQTIWYHQASDRFNRLLPIENFPTLNKLRKQYIHIRKLTDIHLGSSGYKLVLDSDMLFFRKPDALLAWWDQPTQPCLMTDCQESYGYTRGLMEELAGAPIPPLLNVGICGLASECIDWLELETWCQTLLNREGTSYYLEQALVAMLAARSVPMVMPKTDYITFPSREQTMAGDGVLQHYVAESKPWYFGDAWKLSIANGDPN